jgi:pimeloyl-ACP methyl ester carboxylesterase
MPVTLEESAASLSVRDIDVHGVTTELYEGGSGTPILYLHAGEGLRPSAPFFRLLASAGHLLAPVHPGFGVKPRPPSFSTIGDLAYFYLDLLDQLELDKVDVVAADFGGWIAAELAIRSSARLSHLVLAGSTGIKCGGREDRDIADIFALSRPELIELMYADPAISQVGESPLREDFDGLSDDALISIARSRESLAVFGWSPYMHNPRLRQWLHRIDIPTLVVWGARDRFTLPEYGASFAAAIPAARFEVLEDAGHYPHIEQPERFIEVVANFLEIKPSSVVAGRPS